MNRPIRPTDDRANRERIVVLLANAANRLLLTRALAPRYEVLDDFPARGDGDVDLCIVDGLSLHVHWARLLAERTAREPVILPILLLSDRRDAGLTTRAAWHVVDDVLLRPVDRLELAARVESLLRARRLSLRVLNLSSLYEAERRVTERLQEAALPRALPDIPGLALHGYYHAGTEDARIGGDWYDVLRIADGRVVVSIGDVSGSGLDAAVAMATVRQVLRGVAQIHPDPAMMLDAADRTLQAEDPDRMVTAFVAVIDRVTDELTYACAGHPRPLLRRDGGAWSELDASGLPLGAPGRIPRVVETTTMRAGNVLVLYTDGLTEASWDVLAGEAALRAALADEDVFRAQNPARAIRDAVAGDAARDDIAVFTVHRVGDDEADAIRRWTFHSSDVDAARMTRREFSDALLAHRFDVDALGAAEVVYAELLGNVVRYAPGMVTVALDLSGAAPVLHVMDEGRGFRHLPKLPDDVLSERGRGLYIVSSFTDDFTVTRRPHGGSHARAVLGGTPARFSAFDALVAFADLDTAAIESL